MRDINLKTLHEDTSRCLDEVKRGQRFRVLRNGVPDALLLPITEQTDPSWDEIMEEVRTARQQARPTTPNPVLAERKKRNYAGRLR